MGATDDVTIEEPEHYRAKHPTGTPPDPGIAAALTERAVDGRITCPEAHEVARHVGVTPADVGTTADLIECRITTCQLGLFGYKPEKKIVRPAEEVSEDLRDRLDQAAIGGAIDCATLWKIAEALGLEKMVVSAACERLEVKIVRCQIGAF